MKKYLIEFVGFDYSYGDKDYIEFQVNARSAEEAKEMVLKRKDFKVFGEVSVKEL